VHVWVEELDAANIPSGQPRAYRLPYSPALARKVEAAREQILKGHPTGGRAVDIGPARARPRPKGPPTLRRSAPRPHPAAIQPAAARSIYRS